MNLHICIPLKSKSVSASWSSECIALQDVFNSIFSQSNTNIKPIIYLACNEIPDFIETYAFKKYVSILKLELLEIPTSPQEKNQDKQLKKKIALDEISKSVQKDDLIAIFDADDLCHSDLFRTIENKIKVIDCTDFIFYTGYMYNKNTNDFAYIDGVNNIFYKVCGSCIISKVLLTDIENKLDFFYKLNNHTKFYEICENNGRKPNKFTFPAMLYMHDSVNNLSSGNIYIRKMFQDLKVDSTFHFVNLMKYFSGYKMVNDNLIIVSKSVDVCREIIFKKLF